MIASEAQILKDGRLVAAHPIPEGRGRRGIAEGHSRLRPSHNSITPHAGAATSLTAPAGIVDVVPRSLAFEEAIGRLFAAEPAR